LLQRVRVFVNPEADNLEDSYLVELSTFGARLSDMTSDLVLKWRVIKTDVASNLLYTEEKLGTRHRLKAIFQRRFEDFLKKDFFNLEEQQIFLDACLDSYLGLKKKEREFTMVNELKRLSILSRALILADYQGKSIININLQVNGGRTDGAPILREFPHEVNFEPAVFVPMIGGICETVYDSKLKAKKQARFVVGLRSRVSLLQNEFLNELSLLGIDYKNWLSGRDLDYISILWSIFQSDGVDMSLLSREIDSLNKIGFDDFEKKLKLYDLLNLLFKQIKKVELVGDKLEKDRFESLDSYPNVINGLVYLFKTIDNPSLEIYLEKNPRLKKFLADKLQKIVDRYLFYVQQMVKKHKLLYAKKGESAPSDKPVQVPLKGVKDLYTLAAIFEELDLKITGFDEIREYVKKNKIIAFPSDYSESYKERYVALTMVKLIDRHGNDIQKIIKECFSDEAQRRTFLTSSDFERVKTSLSVIRHLKALKIGSSWRYDLYSDPELLSKFMRALGGQFGAYVLFLRRVGALEEKSKIQKYWFEYFKKVDDVKFLKECGLLDYYTKTRNFGAVKDDIFFELVLRANLSLNTLLSSVVKKDSKRVHDLELRKWG